MRSIHAWQGTCCGSDISWLCILCDRVSCMDHDPSPGEDRGICELCYLPADFEEGTS